MLRLSTALLVGAAALPLRAQTPGTPTLGTPTPGTPTRDTAPTCPRCAEWNAPQRPFRIHGDTWWVGTHGLGAILVTSSQGHVLIDGALPESAPGVLASIRALGFRPEDVKLILNTHAHYDHAGGIAALQRATGAAVAASPPSARVLERGTSGPDDPQYGILPSMTPVPNVRVLADGETVRVGPLALTAHFTGGHTPGGTTWTWRACDGARCLDLVYADSQTPVSADGFSFARSTTYPAAVHDFEHGAAVLDALPCDVLLTPHPDASGLWERVAARDAGQADALVDRGACRRYAATARQALARRLATESSKPRVVVTTDPELDDANSLVRYLLYSTDFRTEGLVYASSQYHWKGDGTGKTWAVPNREYFKFGLSLCPCASWRWAPGERFIDDAVDLYEQVYPNLRVHRPDYPTPAALRSTIRWGNVAFDGDIAQDTPGSDLVRDLLLDDGAEPIYLLAWGGASTIARALKSIEERHAGTTAWPAIRAKVSRKAILALSGDQDDTYAHYIRPNWPDVRTLPTGQGGVGLGYGAFVFASAENAPYYSAAWTRAHVSSRGPLGAHYRVWGDGKQMVAGDRFDYFGFAGQTAAELRAKGYVVWLPPRPPGEFLGEGDTFTYLSLVDNGLDAYQDETPGGWAGRVVVNPASRGATPGAGQGSATTSFDAFLRSLEGIGPEGPATRPPSPQPNFTPAAQNDFAARIAWSATPTYAGANHEPVVTVRSGARVEARAGETVRLVATTSDPDGNAVAVRWWRWKDVDTYPGEVAISDATSLTARLQVPNDAAPGQRIQLVLEATDDGRPALTRYRRVVVSVTR